MGWLNVWKVLIIKCLLNVTKRKRGMWFESSEVFGFRFVQVYHSRLIVFCMHSWESLFSTGANIMNNERLSKSQFLYNIFRTNFSNLMLLCVDISKETTPRNGS